MSLRAAALIAVCLLARPLPSWGQAAPPHLIVDNVDITRDTAPQVQNGVLLLPAQALSWAFGATAAWDAGTQTLTLTGAAGTVVRLSPGRPRARFDGFPWDLPAAPILRGGTIW